MTHCELLQALRWVKLSSGKQKQLMQHRLVQLNGAGWKAGPTHKLPKDLPSIQRAGRTETCQSICCFIYVWISPFGIPDEVWTTTKGSRFCSLTPRSTKTALGGRWAAPAQHQPPVCPSPAPPQGQQSTGRFFILISRVILPLEKRDHAFSETYHNFLKNVWPLLSVSPFSWTKK